jgi:hypothetical protein
MRVYKNLFGNGSKINASEIVTKNPAGEVTALDLLGVECGSNANGEWVRFNFGLQICWHYFGPVILDIDDLNAGIYRSALQEHAFPVPFIEPPAIAVSMSAPGNYGVWVAGGCTHLSEGRSQWRYRAFRNTSGTAVDIRAVSMIAIGRWKTPGT